MAKTEISISLFWKSQLRYLKMSYRTCVPKYMRVSAKRASKYKPDINKRKESKVYPHFSIWTIELNNQRIGEGKCLFIIIFQLTDEIEIIKIRTSAFFKPNEWLATGSKHYQWLLTSPQGRQPDVLPTEVPNTSLPWQQD